MRQALLFATTNPAKRRLFAPLFAADGFDCVTLAEVGTRQVAESGATAVENALLKARAYHNAQWPFVFADDAGVEIDALGGEPGVQARRWGGRFSNEISDEDWLAYLLARLEGVPLARRTGRFVSGWALLTADGREHTRRVVLEFVVAETPQRPMVPGFPLSAVILGDAHYLGTRRAQVAAEWSRWNALAPYANGADSSSQAYSEGRRRPGERPRSPMGGQRRWPWFRSLTW